MDDIARLLILLILSPLVVLTLHTVVSRYYRGRVVDTSPQMVSILCVLLGHIPMGFSIWYLVLKDFLSAPDRLISTALYSLVVYNAMGYTYFHVFNMSETSRRIRILYEIYRAGALSQPDIARLYDTDDMVSVRIERLVLMGQIKQYHGRYVLDRRLFYHVARAVALWGTIIRSPFILSITEKNAVDPRGPFADGKRR